jgi:hypothetical protein
LELTRQSLPPAVIALLEVFSESSSSESGATKEYSYSFMTIFSSFHNGVIFSQNKIAHPETQYEWKFFEIETHKTMCADILFE